MFLNFLQPEFHRFNLWHLAIGCLSLLLAIDVENNTKKFLEVNGTKIETGYATIVQSTSPDTFVTMIAALILVCPHLYKIATIPFVTNLCMLALEKSFEKGTSYACGVGFALSTVFVGRGYGIRTTGFVTAMTYFSAPLVSMLYDYLLPSFDSFTIKVALVSVFQIVMYCLSILCPIYFEEVFIRKLLHYQYTAADLRQPWIRRILTILDWKEEYFSELMTTTLMGQRLHRRNSQPFISLSRETPAAKLEIISDVINKYLDEGTDITTCKITKNIITLTEEGEKILRDGSPHHAMVNKVLGMTGGGFRQRAWEDELIPVTEPLDSKERQVLDECVSKKYLRRNGVEGRIYYTLRTRPGVDEVQKVLKSASRGKATAKDLKNYRDLKLYRTELHVAGNFAIRNQFHKELPDFELIVKR